MQQNNTELNEYIDNELGLFFKYPKSLIVVKDNISIGLATSAEDKWSYNFSATSTKFQSVTEWLSAQPKGSSTTPGFAPSIRLDANSFLVYEYVVVDYDGKVPIYVKYREYIYIKSGKLLKMTIAGQLRPEDDPKVSDEALSIISSFKFLSQDPILQPNPFANQESAEFKDANADFSFIYPSSWNYEKDLRIKEVYLEANHWKFRYQGNLILELGAPPYEPAYDGCLDVEGRVPSDYYSDIQIYPTNNKNTTVLKQTCESVTYITWYPGFHPKNVEEILNSNTPRDYKKFHIIRLYSSGEFQDYLDWGNRIAKSIRIK